MSITIEMIRAQAKADIARQFVHSDEPRRLLEADVDAEQPQSDVSLLLAVREAMFRHGHPAAGARPLAVGYRGYLQDCYDVRI